MSEAMFRSVGQALHVAHLVGNLEPSVKVSTEILIEALKERMGKGSEHETTINARGLTPIEFRGQCAMILSVAASILTKAQNAAVAARYAPHSFRLRAMTGRTVKAQAVIDLAEHMLPQLKIEREAANALVWRHYAKNDKAAGRWSMRRIGEETSTDRGKLRGAELKISKLGHALEMAAEATLEARFVSDGLVEHRANLLPA